MTTLRHRFWLRMLDVTYRLRWFAPRLYLYCVQKAVQSVPAGRAKP